jgi:hypothetical protein
MGIRFGDHTVVSEQHPDSFQLLCIGSLIPNDIVAFFYQQILEMDGVNVVQ